MNGWNRVGLVGMCALAAAVSLGGPAAGFVRAQPDARTQSQKTVTIVENDGKRTVKLEISNGEIRTAEIDGKSVPADRIERDGDTVRLKNEAGEVVYEYNLAGEDSASGTANAFATPFGHGGSNWAERRAFRHSFGTRGGTQDPDATIVKVETPKVMIGVQLVEPDSAIRGHFGLKRGEASMVASVFEGLPASNAGLEPYDIIVGINGKTPVSTDDVREALRDQAAGANVNIDVIKKGQRTTLKVVPESYDADKLHNAKRKSVAAVELDENNPFAYATSFGSLPALNGTAAIVPGVPAASGQDMILGVGPGGNGRAPRQIYLQLGDQQRQMAEELRRMAEDMREAFGAEAQQRAADASKDLDAQIKDLEQSLKRLREQRLAPKSGSGTGGGASGAGGSSSNSQPPATIPHDPQRESMNTRSMLYRTMA